jgi:hypothetical protein
MSVWLRRAIGRGQTTFNKAYDEIVSRDPHDRAEYYKLAEGNVEMWRPIEGYDFTYAVSSIGRVMNLRTQSILEQVLIDGLLHVNLAQVGEAPNLVKVHHLVVMMRGENFDERDHIVSHESGVKTDNSWDNLNIEPNYEYKELKTDDFRGYVKFMTKDGMQYYEVAHFTSKDVQKISALFIVEYHNKKYKFELACQHLDTIKKWMTVCDDSSSETSYDD